jgi:hypothetical protein
MKLIAFAGIAALALSSTAANAVVSTNAVCLKLSAPNRTLAKPLSGIGPDVFTKAELVTANLASQCTAKVAGSSSELFADCVKGVAVLAGVNKGKTFKQIRMTDAQGATLTGACAKPAATVIPWQR